MISNMNSFITTIEEYNIEESRGRQKFSWMVDWIKQNPMNFFYLKNTKFILENVTVEW